MKTLDQIAATLQGYDPNAMAVSAVHDFISKLVTAVQELQDTPLMETLGKVLASDVVSPFDVPPHDNSAMDGYAFDGKQLPTAANAADLSLAVVGTALAGAAWVGSAGPGQCVRIMTGAIMPPGCDTVVPQELVHLVNDRIRFSAHAVRPGDNRRLRGEDLTQGQPALQKGERITPARLGLAASLGLKTLPCWRPLRVAYFSTGDEILSLGEPAREGAVYDSNRYTVFGMLSRLDCTVIDMGVVRDDPMLLEAAFVQAASRADAIITSGGVSVGEADYTKAVMRKIGDMAFWRIAMRLGRPMAVGRVGKGEDTAIVFGLPGNPVAVMVTFLAFVRPALLQMMGATACPLPLLQARSTEPIRKKPGRTEYQRAWVSTSADGSLQVRTTGSQGSGVLRSMAEANGLLVLRHEQSDVSAGDTVEVMMFDGAF